MLKSVLHIALFFWSIFLFSQIKEKQDYAYLKRQTNPSRTFKGTFSGKPFYTEFRPYKTAVNPEQSYITRINL